MEHATSQEILDRLLLATKLSRDIDLASPLGITVQAVKDAINREKIPDKWVRIIAGSYGISADWLFFGRGSMNILEAQFEPDLKDNGSSHAKCENCEKLEMRLQVVEDERRELSRDVRRLSKEKDDLYSRQEKLLIENGDLKAKLARLEERLKAGAGGSNTDRVSVVVAEEEARVAS